MAFWPSRQAESGFCAVPQRVDGIICVTKTTTSISLFLPSPLATLAPAAMSLVDQTLGAVLVGFALSCCVYGVLCTQMFTYFRNYPGDKRHFKITVGHLMKA